MTAEGKVKQQIKDWCKTHDIWYFMHVPSGRGVAGIPDFLCCWMGKFFAIEAKAPGEKPRPTQVLQLGLINKAGGLTFVVDEVSKLKDVEDALWGKGVTV